MNHVMTLLFDRDFLITLVVGIMAFATVVTIGVPYLERGGLDDRLKSVARRREELLVDGTILVTSAEADLVRIEGRLAKNPSIWTKRVDIVRRYERVNGVRVPVEMSSTADVLIVGHSSFTMRYDYESVNGVPVGAAPGTSGASPRPGCR